MHQGPKVSKDDDGDTKNKRLVSIREIHGCDIDDKHRNYDAMSIVRAAGCT